MFLFTMTVQSKVHFRTICTSFVKFWFTVDIFTQWKKIVTNEILQKRPPESHRRKNATQFIKVIVGLDVKT